MRRGKLGLTFAVLAVMLASGCTGQAGDPPTTEPPSPSVTPSPTPTPTPTPEAAIAPERPDMSQVDDATAEAITRYYLELYPYVYATGDLTDYRSLSHPECIFCTSVITNVEAMFAAGQHSEGGLLALGPATVRHTDRLWLVSLEMVQQPSSTVSGAGEVVEEFPETKTIHVDTVLMDQDGSLVVRELTPTEVTP